MIKSGRLPSEAGCFQSKAPEELEKASDAVGWCDVCKGWEETV
jgi:hypothetical protein